MASPLACRWMSPLAVLFPPASPCRVPCRAPVRCARAVLPSRTSQRVNVLASDKYTRGAGRCCCQMERVRSRRLSLWAAPDCALLGTVCFTVFGQLWLQWGVGRCVLAAPGYSISLQCLSFCRSIPCDVRHVFCSVCVGNMGESRQLPPVVALYCMS